MNKETYEALKEIIQQGWIERLERQNNSFRTKDLEQVENWIDEVAKDYEMFNNQK